MASAYGTIARPSKGIASLAETFPLENTLKDNTIVRVFHIAQEQEQGAIFAPRYPKLLSRMHTLFNAELEDGNTYPQEELMDESQFRAYFLSHDAFVVVQVTKTGGGEDAALDDGTADWERELLGFFYVKPTFPGRCSHV
jgi:hypothetical protein